MLRALLLLVLLPLYAETAGPVRELVYPQAIGGRIMPRYDKGYLIYLEHPNHIEIHGPDGLRYFETDVACPGGGTCSTSDAALNSRGEIAVGMGYSGPKGYRGAIRIYDRTGADIRLIETGLYLPGRLAYDKRDSLWTLGWQEGSDANR